MSYLIPKDYNKSIQVDNLQQIIGSDITIQSAAELTALEEAISYLKQKYDVSKEFTDTLQHNADNVYYPGDRVYLDYPAFDPTATYQVGDFVTYQGKEYFANALVNPSAWNPDSWTYVDIQYAIYNAKFPYPTFDLYKLYSVGDNVFYKGHTYTALKASIVLDSDQALQYYQYGNLPYKNTFPDDPVSGASYWTDNGDASFQDEPITDGTNWQSGDNRSQVMVTYIVAIALYWIHQRIAPRNIPDLRVKCYDDAIKWLKQCAKGEDITAPLPKLQPNRGNRIRYGGNIKNQNSY